MSLNSILPPMVVDPFCYRQFAEFEQSKGNSETVFNISMEEFTNIVNARFSEDKLRDGYAPFCKHLFVVNDFTEAQVNVLEITPENEALLRTRYEARNDKELPVLGRYFPKELVDYSTLPVAKYLDLILYSREQIRKENSAMNKDETGHENPWGIVSIKAQNVDSELPMQPITVMRNALGKDQGGSGVPLEREAYMKSYEYWNKHATIS